MEEARQPLDWDTVYWEHLPRVYKYFCYQVGDIALAEDLTATTFVKAWRARREYNPSRGALTTWLLTIARNTATDYYRRERMNLPLETVRLPVTEERPVEEALEAAQDIVRLNTLLGQLAPRERELIALKYGAGMTNRAMARLLDMSESSVGSALYRAIRWLRAAWEVGAHE
jgi:RNA polymerase sigma-70 factor (ECF subfamily)